MNMFKKLLSIVATFPLSLWVLWRHIKCIDKFIVKNDEAMLNTLLRKESDKVIFTKTVYELLKNNEDSKVIYISNKKITVSIIN